MFQKNEKIWIFVQKLYTLKTNSVSFFVDVLFREFTNSLELCKFRLELKLANITPVHTKDFRKRYL